MRAYIGSYDNVMEGDRYVDIEFRNSDFWNLDQTLAIIIHASLVEYRKNHLFGCPAVADEYVPDELKTGVSDEDPELEFSMDKWKYALDMMIAAFHEIATEEREYAVIEKCKYSSVNPYATEEFRQITDDIDAGLFFFAEYFRGLWN